MNKGYEDFAITNNIIIVWPDTRCWGEIAEGYDINTNDGLLQTAFRGMIDRLTTPTEISCQTYVDLIDEAQTSVTSVIDFLAG